MTAVVIFLGVIVVEIVRNNIRLELARVIGSSALALVILCWFRIVRGHPVFVVSGVLFVAAVIDASFSLCVMFVTLLCSLISTAIIKLPSYTSRV